MESAPEALPPYPDPVDIVSDSATASPVASRQTSVSPVGATDESRATRSSASPTGQLTRPVEAPTHSIEPPTHFLTQPSTSALQAPLLNERTSSAAAVPHLSPVQITTTESPVPTVPASTAPAPATPTRGRPSDYSEWPLKTIRWPPRIHPNLDTHSVRIVCQNKNGPCSLIALCNILILRGDIHISPTRQTVDYSYLSEKIAEYILNEHLNEDDQDNVLSQVLSVLPTTQFGLELNPMFDTINGFAPDPDVSDRPNALSPQQHLFRLCGVPLVHGWVIDPEDTSSFQVLAQTCRNYDNAVMELVNEPKDDYELAKQEVIRQFLSEYQTQLTYYGITRLSHDIPPYSLVAFFRNSHVNVMYSVSPQHASNQGLPSLYTLVTDVSLLNQPRVVWESLVDVDGHSSEFYDYNLRRYLESAEVPESVDDHTFAQQLQDQEDHRLAQQVYRQEQHERQMALQKQQNQKLPSSKLQKNKAQIQTKNNKKTKKKTDCTIM